MNIKILKYLVFCLFSISVMGQTNNNINQKNDKGEKVGLWVENNGLIEAYYKAGLKDGIYKTYNRKNGKLSALGEFSEGRPSGTWYYFDEASILIFQECEIKYNTNYTTMRDDGVEITPKFTSYVKFYYPNGYIKEEGRVLYFEDIEIDYFKTGTWRYYNKQGKLEQTKEH